MDSSGAGGPKVTEHQIMNQMQAELQVAAMQEFFQARRREMRDESSATAPSSHPSHPIPLIFSLSIFSSSFIQTVRDKCFEKCVTKPSSSLSSSEQQCLSRCSDRYGEATQAVLRAVLEQSGLQ